MTRSSWSWGLVCAAGLIAGLGLPRAGFADDGKGKGQPAGSNIIQIDLNKLPPDVAKRLLELSRGDAKKAPAATPAKGKAAEAPTKGKAPAAPAKGKGKAPAAPAKGKAGEAPTKGKAPAAAPAKGKAGEAPTKGKAAPAKGKKGKDDDD